MSRITAIVPTYNRAGLLASCLDSLLRQQRPVDEILVIDDGSTDGTTEVVSGYGDRVRYLRQENRGKPVAVNLGIAEATGDYIWICDDDDIALEGATSQLAAVLDEQPHGFSYGSFLRFTTDPATGECKTYGPGYWPEEPEDTFATLLDDFFIFQFATLVRREAYAAVGPFREDLVRSQDYDMALRLAHRFTGGYVAEPVFLQREHDAARGSGQDRFDASKRFTKWIEYDQRIFRALYDDIPLEDYAPRALASAPSDVRLRAALVKRACVFARKKLWDVALPDLNRAVEMGGEAAPEPAELAVAAKMLLGKYGCRELVDDAALLQSLQKAARGGRYGRVLLNNVAKPLLWRTRAAAEAGRGGEAVGYAVALARLQGARGLSQIAGRALASKMSSSRKEDGKLDPETQQQLPPGFVLASEAARNPAAFSTQ